MKKIFFFGACLVALASQPVMAQAGGAQVGVMQVYYTGMSAGHVMITRGPGKPEVTDFASRDFKQNEAAVQAASTKLYQQGYVLKGTLSPGAGPNSTLVFTKEKQPGWHRLGEQCAVHTFPFKIWY